MKFLSVEFLQQNPMIINGRIDKFGKELDSDKRSPQSLMANDQGSIDFSKIFTHLKEISNS
jgi:hypothetical protein